MDTSVVRDFRYNFDLLSEDDLAVMLGLAAGTLRVWRSRKEGPDYVKLGAGVFYRGDDIRAWMANHIVTVEKPAKEAGDAS